MGTGERDASLTTQLSVIQGDRVAVTQVGVGTTSGFATYFCAARQKGRTLASKFRHLGRRRAAQESSVSTL